MRRPQQLSRRDWLIATAGTALGMAARGNAWGLDLSPGLAPAERDAEWLSATAKYAPERARLLALAEEAARSGPFRPDWASLQTHATPKWYEDAKFGIFIHWGVYSVPAFGSEWYARDMYVQGSPEFAHHIATYGPQTEFGYKDFIPRFKGEHFDAASWIQLFRDAGARYLVPVAEHHDGFAMYDTQLSGFSAARLGPRRDVLAELKEAAANSGLHFCLSSHRAEHDWFFDQGRNFPSDVRDPANAGLYGPAQARIHESDNDDDLFRDYTYVSQAFLDDWLARQVELVERYSPELIYFDWWIGQPSFRNTLPKFLACYYNRAVQRGQEAIVNYKLGEFADGAGILDIERGGAPGIAKETWQTCTSISDKSWGYIENDRYKDTDEIVHMLADVVSKNGNLLLNAGPRADGQFPLPVRERLAQIGAWLKRNGEAIYGTRPWTRFGEGPTQNLHGSFSEGKAKPYTAQDLRFTARQNTLYAIQLGRPQGGSTRIASLRPEVPVHAVRLLGSQETLRFRQDENGLTVSLPSDLAPQPAYVYRLERG